MTKDSVEIRVLQQGDAVCGETGYMLKRGDNVAAFFLDGWGNTGRVYSVMSSSISCIDGKYLPIPSLTIENGNVNSTFTEICFPEFEGWNVHSVSGGKTMAICLTMEDSK